MADPVETPAAPAASAAPAEGGAPAAAAPAAAPAGAAAAEPSLLAPATTETPAGEAPKTEGDKPAGEAKPDGETGDKPAEGDADKSGKEKEQPAGAPETYADFTAPEGVTLDPQVTGDLKALAKELNLPQDVAQKVADLGVKLVAKHQEAAAGVLSATRDEWKAQAQSDPEFGGAKLEETLVSARKGLAFAATPALAELIESSGLGNHPEFIRMFAKVGAALSEDKIVTGNGSPAAKEKAFGTVGLYN